MDGTMGKGHQQVLVQTLMLMVEFLYRMTLNTLTAAHGGTTCCACMPDNKANVTDALSHLQADTRVCVVLGVSALL